MGQERGDIGVDFVASLRHGVWPVAVEGHVRENHVFKAVDAVLAFDGDPFLHKPRFVHERRFRRHLAALGQPAQHVGSRLGFAVVSGEVAQGFLGEQLASEQGVHKRGAKPPAHQRGHAPGGRKCLPQIVVKDPGLHELMLEPPAEFPVFVELECVPQHADCVDPEGAYELLP